MEKLKTLTKKVILSCLVFVLLAFSFVPKAYAQTGGEGTWYGQSFQEWYTKVYDSSNPSEIFGERYTAAQVQWVMYGLLSFLLRLPVQGNGEALDCMLSQGQNINECVDLIRQSIDNLLSGGDTNQQGKNLRGFSGVASIITTNPVSGIGYFKDVALRWHLVPEAKAQGFGFTAAGPVLKLWKVARDISYTLLVIVIVVLSFMIMFRVKISPQVVITAQSALPKIVVALVLITFSYAIAGFMIDLMYVVIGIVVLLITNSGLSEANWQSLFASLTTGLNGFSALMLYWLYFLFSSFFAIFTLNVGAIIPAFLLFLFSILAILLLLWYSLKIIILLLKTYVQIILAIIIGPIQILFGTVAQGAGFGPWLRNLLSLLAVYPTVSLLLALAFLFISAGAPDFIQWGAPFFFKPAVLSGTPWDPPLTLGTGWGNTSKILWIVVSFFIITLIPKVSDIIQGLISGKPFAYGTAIGEAVGRPASLATLGYGQYAASQFKEGGVPRPLGYIPGIRRLDPKQRRVIGEVLNTLTRAFGR
jgi:hypothetical protein